MCLSPYTILMSFCQCVFSDILSNALLNATTKCWPSTIELRVNIKHVVNFKGDNGTTPIFLLT